MPLNPRHSGTFTLTWEEKEIGRIGIEGLYTDRQALIDNPYRSTSPSLLMFGVLLQRRIGPVSVFLNAENLADRRLTRVQPLVLPSRAPNGLWTTDAWGPLDGRVINLGLRWRFGAGAEKADAGAARGSLSYAPVSQRVRSGTNRPLHAGSRASTCFSTNVPASSGL